MPGLGTSLGRGGATTAPQDLQNADAILIMGSSMAENHPVAFRFVIDARERGATVLAKGERLTPAGLGLAASIGTDQLQVARRPRVALFSTGDELVMPGEVPPGDMKPGAIYNSNRFFLRALLRRLGCEITDYGIVPDRLDATQQALRRAAEAHDLILTSGGVSVGEEDHIKPAVEAEGQLNMWQIAVKPGKPLAFGEVDRSAGGAAFFIGLPGNPRSALVVFRLIGMPIVRQVGGCTDPPPDPTVRARLERDLPSAAGRLDVVQVRLADGEAIPLFGSSSLLSILTAADGYVVVPEAATGLAAGSEVEVTLYG